MKKIFVLIAFYSAPIFSFSQTLLKPLTIREAFNFSIGDTFQHKLQFERYDYVKCTDSVIYSQHIIIDKEINDSNTILKYRIKRGFKEPYLLDSLVYTKLDSFVAIEYRYASFSGFYQKDTTYYQNSMKKTVFQKGSIYDNSTYSFIEGFGEIGFYYIDDARCNSRWKISRELIYLKNGDKKWGTPLTISSDKTPSVSAAKISISPNPASEVLKIETDIDFDKIQIVNLNGQVVLKGNSISEISVANLPNGLYGVQVFNGGVLIGMKKMVISH